MFYTYVIKRKKDNKWYAGYTKDLRKRLQEHSDNRVFATKGRGPFELIYYEACSNEEDARMREKYLKSGMGKRYLNNRLKRFLSLTGFTPLEIRHPKERQSPRGDLSLTGFTLIELLAVMVIILVIAGMFVGVSGPASQSAKKRKAEVMISALEVAICMYHADTGAYPPSDNPAGAGTTAKLNDYLSTGGIYSGETSPPTGWSGPYMKFRGEDISPGYQIIDPWGTSYAYNSVQPGHVPAHNANSFDLWSCGHDKENDEGTAGTDPDDDIKNW